VSICAVGAGSNVGDRFSHLNAALEGLRSVSSVVAVSPVYESEPVGGPTQGPYLNAVLLIETALTPTGLLRSLLLIERARGRVRNNRWGPRTLDLDLLLWDRMTINVDGLVVPHPQIRHRRFVLEPLFDVWPEATMPDGSPVSPADGNVIEQTLIRLDWGFGDAAPAGT